MNLPIGTFINAASIVVGSLIGTVLHKSLSEKVKTIAFQGTGLVVLIIGIDMGLEVENVILMAFSVLIGGILGEMVDLERWIDNFANKFKEKVKSRAKGLVEGAVAASLIVCIGSMAIMGSLNEGLTGDRTLLVTKAILDGFIVITLASSYGVSVAFSAIPILIYQGGMTLFASFLLPLLSGVVINQITAIGGILIMAIGINFLEIKKIRVVNLLPALPIGVILTLISS
jgi:uncharacterized membrane protein YqgA involved in biofilm formation